jgi:hypothetical protein
MDRVPPDQSLASRSVVKSACIASNGVYEAGRSEGTGRVFPQFAHPLLPGGPFDGQEQGLVLVRVDQFNRMDPERVFATASLDFAEQDTFKGGYRLAPLCREQPLFRNPDEITVDFDGLAFAKFQPPDRYR